MGNVDYDYWDTTPFPGNFAWCQQHYNKDGVNGITTDTKIFTAIIILCSLWLEVIVHANVGSARGGRSTSATSNLNNTIPNDDHDIESFPSNDIQERRDSGIGSSSSSSSSTEDLSHSHNPILAPNKTKPTAYRWPTTTTTLRTITHLHPPPLTSLYTTPSIPARPSVRFARLLLSTFIYSIILGCFILRMKDVHRGGILLYGCQNYIPVARMSWPVIILFNILPFACATGAFARTVVDCVLLKWGRGVHSNWRDGWWDERGVVWVVFMPVVGVVWIVWGVGKGVVRVVRRAVVVLGGIRNSRLLRWRRDGRKGESKREVILGEEEDVGLLGSRSRGSVSSNEIEIESSGTEK